MGSIVGVSFSRSRSPTQNWLSYVRTYQVLIEWATMNKCRYIPPWWLDDRGAFITQRLTRSRPQMSNCTEFEVTGPLVTWTTDTRMTLRRHSPNHFINRWRLRRNRVILRHKYDTLGSAPNCFYQMNFVWYFDWIWGRCRNDVILRHKNDTVTSAPIILN